ncbi:hypothetical protein L3476_03820 [Paenibacillus thiaminolyticus]|uniref:hypothetical protein n=1 Tax=Paenibacillus thiaminolyticus TaxID=49283 RepID=UPI00234FC864|nr:hypothetical protein [Paenibacillus thiaminolyticus]WCR27918.1 hypothetical protein L3476_03820 [Paenibacillus thiaminolyticus]
MRRGYKKSKPPIMDLTEGENGAKGSVTDRHVSTRHVSSSRVTSYLLSRTSVAASGEKDDRLEDQSSQATEGDGYRPSAFIR